VPRISTLQFGLPSFAPPASGPGTTRQGVALPSKAVGPTNRGTAYGDLDPTTVHQEHRDSHGVGDRPALEFEPHSRPATFRLFFWGSRAAPGLV